MVESNRFEQNSWGLIRGQYLVFWKTQYRRIIYRNMGCGVILTVTDTKEQLRAQPYLIAAKPQPKRGVLQSNPSRVNITLQNQTQKIIKDASQPIKIVKQDGKIEALPLLPIESPNPYKDIPIGSGRRKHDGDKSSMEVKQQYQAVVNQNNNSTQKSNLSSKKENAGVKINLRSEEIKQTDKQQLEKKAQKKQAVIKPTQKIAVSPRLQANNEKKQQTNASKQVKKENEKINQVEKKVSTKQEQKQKRGSSQSNRGVKQQEKSPTIVGIKREQAQIPMKKEEPKETSSATLKKQQSKLQLAQSTKLKPQSTKNKPPSDRNPPAKQESTSIINKPHSKQLDSDRDSKTKEEQKHFDRKDLVQTSYITNTSKKAQPAVSKQSILNKPKVSKASKKHLNEISTLFLDAEVINGSIPTQKDNVGTAKETIAQTQVGKGQISSRPTSRQQLKTGGSVKNKNLMSIRESKNKDPLLDTLQNVNQDSKLEKELQDEPRLEEKEKQKDLSSRKSLVSRKELKAAELQRDLKKIRESMKKIKEEEKKKLEKQSNHLKKIYNL